MKTIQTPDQPRSTQLRSDRRQPHQRRVVITGMGAITPLGNTVDALWAGLVAGRSGAGHITVMDVTHVPFKVGAELKGFNPEAFIPRKIIRHMSLATQVAVVAAKQAIDASALDLDLEDRDRIGVVSGTAGGSAIEETEAATRYMIKKQVHRLSPFQILRFWPNMQAFFIAQMSGLRGYNLTVSTACAAATQAIGEAAHAIQRGEADVMVAGGSEVLISQTATAGFASMRALSTKYNDEPHRAMRPFDAERDGFIPGIGGAFLVLEELDHAHVRGATIQAEVLGSGASNDAYHMIMPDPQGEGAALAMQRALADAGIDREAVDYINAHGASTPLGDAAETRAIKAIFGERAYQIPINSTKSMIGHLMGATGAVEAVATVMTLKEGIIHPTINYENPDPECDLDYVPNLARKAHVQTALVNSCGLGGQNACLVLRRYPD